MAKTVQDIIFNKDLNQRSNHKPKDYYTNANSGYSTPDLDRTPNIDEFVMVKLDGILKSGIVKRIAYIGFERKFYVKLLSNHGGNVVEVCQKDIFAKND